MKHCHACGQPLHLSDAELVAQRIDAYREWLRANGKSLLPGDEVNEANAAALIGRAVKTLANNRYGAQPIPFRRTRAGARYTLQSLAEYEVSNNIEI